MLYPSNDAYMRVGLLPEQRLRWLLDFGRLDAAELDAKERGAAVRGGASFYVDSGDRSWVQADCYASGHRSATIRQTC